MRRQSDDVLRLEAPSEGGDERRKSRAPRYYPPDGIRGNRECRRHAPPISRFGPKKTRTREAAPTLPHYRRAMLPPQRRQLIATKRGAA